VFHVFLRELLPRTSLDVGPWGALAVAFQPTFDFIARGRFRATTCCFPHLGAHLLDAAAGGRIGGGPSPAAARLAIGLVVRRWACSRSWTFIGLLPGIALTLALLGWAGRCREGRGPALRKVGIAVAVVVIPVALYALLKRLSAWASGAAPTGGRGRRKQPTARSPAGGAVDLAPKYRFDYIWELYLPRLWFMHHSYFNGIPPLASVAGRLDRPLRLARLHVPQLGLHRTASTPPIRVFFALRAPRPRAGWRGGAPRAVLPNLRLLWAVIRARLDGRDSATPGSRYRLSTGFPFEAGAHLFCSRCWTLYAVLFIVARKPRGRPAARRWGPPRSVAGLVLLAMGAMGLFAETLTILAATTG